MTEFLPISSSGHLVFFQSLFGTKESPIFFDVALHLGTLMAVVVYFWSDIWKIAQGLGAILKRRQKNQPQVKLFLLIIVATIPTGLMGILLRDWFGSFFLEPKIVGMMLLVTGIVLWMTRWMKTGEKNLGEMRGKDALLIGLVQGIAIIPGISRSGATISTGLFMGLDRELSGRFSFLLSIPAILGATLLEFRKIDYNQKYQAILIGTAIAFVVGILSLKLLMKIIKFGKINIFSYYCWGVGITMVLLTR